MMSGFASKKSFDGIMNPEKMKILWLKAQTVYLCTGIREDLLVNAVLCVDVG